MRLLAAAAVALSAAATAAASQPILVLGDATPVPTGFTRCAATPRSAGADLECVLTLPAPTAGNAHAPPARILIRTEFTPARCASSEAQVVQMSPEPTTKGLPVVEHPSAHRAGCPS